MANTPIYTFHDVQDHLMDVMGSSSESRDLKMGRAAAQSAYRIVSASRNWAYYYRQDRITTDAPYSTGTIAYDHTGGSSERLLTLTGGTWPTNMARGVIVIAGVEYPVATRTSGSLAILSLDKNPGTDIASGTSYEWHRAIYPMPLGIRSTDELIDHNIRTRPDHVTPGEWKSGFQNYQTPSEPRRYAFFADPDYVGVMAVGFHPAPDKVYNFDFMSQVQPLPVRTWDHNDGTVTVSGVTVTGTGTAWTEDMVGSIIRFKDANDVPTSVDGLKPYLEQRVITSFTSATSVDIDSALTNSYTAVKYRVSDMVDIEQGTMYTAFLRCAESELAKSRVDDTAEKRDAFYRAALVYAKEADNRDFSRDSPVSNYIYRLRNRGAAGADVNA